MDRLPTRVNKADPDYSARREHNLALIETLHERLELVHQGGGEKYVDRHRSRNKMLARERIERIIDPGTAFLELSKNDICRASEAVLVRHARSVLAQVHGKPAHKHPSRPGSALRGRPAHTLSRKQPSAA